jgi:hypothetical protein
LEAVDEALAEGEGEAFDLGEGVGSACVAVDEDGCVWGGCVSWELQDEKCAVLVAGFEGMKL